MSYNRLLKSRKALSAIFATLILIAIAVIAGTVVYMFTSGTFATMTANNGASGQEKATVPVATISIKHGATVYVEQTGGPAATVNSLIIKDAHGNTIAAITGSFTVSGVTGKENTVALTSGTLTSINGATPSALTSANVGSLCTVTVTTKAGGSFVSSQVVATA